MPLRAIMLPKFRAHSLAVVFLTLASNFIWASDFSEKRFELELEPTDSDVDELVARIVLRELSTEAQFIADATIYWVMPTGAGMSVPVHPVTDSVLAAKVLGPFPEGKHRLLVSLSQRDESGFIQSIYEREYQVHLPSLVVTMSPMREISAHKPAVEHETKPHGTAAAKAADMEFGFLGWSGIVIGSVTLALALVAMLARMGIMPSIERKMRANRIASTVLRRTEVREAAKAQAEVSAAEALVDATQKIVDQAESPKQAEDEQAPKEKPEESVEPIAAEEEEPVDLEKLSF